MRKSRILRAGGYLLFFALCVGTGITARAQGLGTIVGTVTDPSGGVVPSATVRITDQSTSVSRETTTNTQGYFVFPSTQPATYSLEVKAAGFSPYIRKTSFCRPIRARL